MAITTLSTIVCDEKTDAPALAGAQVLAQRYNAHLTAYALGIDPTRYETLATGAAVTVELGQDEALRRSQELADWARANLASNATTQIEPSVTSQLTLERHIARLARYTDLVVAAQPYREGCSALAPMVIEAVIFGAQRPVLVLPDAEPGQFDTVTVAWNESEEALSAIQHALPLLAQARHVDIVMIDPPSRSAERSDPGGALSLWLARHGAHCEVSVLSKTLPRVSDVIMRFAADKGSDLVVMGAYGHSRFREALLGGPTRDMLEEARHPVLLAR